MRDKSQSIARDGRGEEQSADKERAQKSVRTEPGHMPVQPIEKEKPASGKSAQLMSKYFFHLGGQFPARDVLGHECANVREAKDHGKFIAHRIGTEKPGMVQEGNFISVRNEAGNEIIQIPLSSAMV